VNFMPLIRIKSLPFEGDVDISLVVCNLSQAVADATGIENHHIMVSWEYLSKGHYSHAGKVAEVQGINTHPLLVDLIAPNFNTEQQIMAMLELIANTISEHVPIAKNNIFINYTPAYSDGVYDEGHIVEWDM
jgi:phenylpyruvate tautomerase PptA (4-oxalocrotonate tautomerase family)